MSVITRFAPSTTGLIHLGNLRTAIFNYLFARNKGGKFLLRIENTDQKRENKSSCKDIFNVLDWLNLDFDGEVVYQLDRRTRHKEIVEQLLKSDAAYYCFSSVEEIEAQKQQAISKNEFFKFQSPWRDKKSNYPENIKPVVRLKVPSGKKISLKDVVQGEITVSTDDIDDMVLLRSDGNVSTYMLAAVVDDHDMGITHIIRGADHLTNIFRQAIIYQALDWHIPVICHIPLICNEDGQKFSKRQGASGIDHYKNLGYLPEAIFNYLLRLGWSYRNEEIISKNQAVQWFNLESLGKSPARINYDKMYALNGHYLKNKDNKTLTNLVVELLKQEYKINDESYQFILSAMDELKLRANLITELADISKFYLPGYKINLTDEARDALNLIDIEFIKEIIGIVEKLSNKNKDEIKLALKNFAKEKGKKLSQVMHPIRILVTGNLKSPGMFSMIAILGAKNIINRLKLYEKYFTPRLETK